MKKISPYLFVWILLCVSIVSCKRTGKTNDSWTDTMNSGLIRVSSDESFKSLMDQAISAFEIRYDSAYIIPVYTGETEAIRLLMDDSVRFAMTTRDLNAREAQVFKDKNRVVRSSVIAFDGIALITNLSNPDSIIGLPTLKKILTGEIKTWSQINPKSKLDTIRVLFGGNQSGVLRYAVDSIVRGGTLSPNLYDVNNSAGVVQKVKEMPNAIGMIGFLKVPQDNVRMMRVSNEENATLENSYFPWAGDIVTEHYPLWRPVYILISDPRSGLSTAFGVFMANQIGQKVIQSAGLLTINNSNVMDVMVHDRFPQNN